jgi:dimethylamine---corrinoid protein Co-methyltransferase
MTTITTRMGDGYSVEMTADEVREDLIAGSADAARRGKIEPLAADDLAYLYEMFLAPSRIWGVTRGKEAIVTKDGSTNSLYSAQLSSGVGLPLSREQAFRTFERAFGFDTMEVGHTDYSVKPAKPIVTLEQNHVEAALQTTIIPVFYGFMPNLGLYYRPDGPFANPSDLLPRGQIAEARAATEEALETCYEDVVWMTGKMDEVGCDGINYDTTASTGDGEFLAVLRAVEWAAAHTSMAIEVGMAAECVLGFHGELSYNGKRLAGMWPHQQMKVVEEAGAHLFGPVVNTNSRRSTPWNLSRAITFVKACTAEAQIPIHPNVGMGVGGVPMFECPPIDVVTRCSAAMVEIGGADGL